MPPPGPTRRPSTATPDRLTELPDARLAGWAAWLQLSDTPPTRPGSDPMLTYSVRAGIVIDADRWPSSPRSQIYVCFDEFGPVYVGSTARSLLRRVRNHFGRQTTDLQRRKAGTWQLVVSAVFDDLGANELERCERSAAEWLLPHAHRSGRRHPRDPYQ